MQHLLSLVRKPTVYRFSLSDNSSNLAYFAHNALLKSVPKSAKILGIDISATSLSHSKSKLIAEDIKRFRKERPTTKVYTFAEDTIIGPSLEVLTAGEKVFSSKYTTYGFYKLYRTHVNYGPFLEKHNIQAKFIHKGDNKVPLNPLEPLKEQDELFFTDLREKFHSAFVKRIERNREGKTKGNLSNLLSNKFISPEEIHFAGLIDEYGTFEDTVLQEIPKAKIKNVKIKFSSVFKSYPTTQTLSESIKTEFEASLLHYSVNNMLSSEYKI